MFCSQDVSCSCLYAVFSLISDALLRLYDDSVWTVRNHISQWEARRSQEADYFLLHEIVRHGIHVSETLSVAIRSLDAIQHHHARFRAHNDLVRSEKGCENWDRVGTHFEFQLRFLQALLQRSDANNARIQNEISLVSAVHDGRYAVSMGRSSSISSPVRCGTTPLLRLTEALSRYLETRARKQHRSTTRCRCALQLVREAARACLSRRHALRLMANTCVT
ncbi:hypothetical protein BU23DRAFT_555880 [Bimuria novae-zelandiae CBS 107.79]|uniref:Fungal N-terminal domain-containing protein n=1 Tax=Bimuria novae-zelandiae CBS 107.79 TaxID=1447943 RepID=A0A6A5V5N7_9PLEO|nr:hypothetical protein BU23DRAFT_555880 [Bimuria novae-zelandiae CBS 107.79]